MQMRDRCGFRMATAMIAACSAGCGGQIRTTATGPDGGVETIIDASAGLDAATGRPEPGLLDAAQDGGTQVDAMSDDAQGPQSCTDVGRYPGIATCCGGRYCAGSCWSGERCVCASIGCVWPEICCHNPFGCVGASQCMDDQ